MNELKTTAKIEQDALKGQLDTAETFHNINAKNKQQQIDEITNQLESIQKMVEIMRADNTIEGQQHGG